MYLSSVKIENFRCFGGGAQAFELRLHPGLTALVGMNDSGKSAVIDALRFALGTTDQEWYRLDDHDFRPGENGDGLAEIGITCKFEDLNAGDKRAFVEYLTHGDKPTDKPVLYVNWTAKDTGEKRKGQACRRVEVCSGKNGEGPIMVPDIRELLRAVYLRPLRDAEQALSAGRGSRLAQVLLHSKPIEQGNASCDLCQPLKDQQLSVLAIANLINTLLEDQEGVKATKGQIDENLGHLSLRGESLKSGVKVGGDTSDEARLRQVLEKLDLRLLGDGKLGLGSNNLLFMACELLLLAQEEEGNKLLLIEEPEAHLHAQRQLRIMRFLQEQAKDKGIQVIVTTHSPNLASAIELNNLVMIHNGRAFPMAAGQTKLEKSDYRFLERFLDVTKANLFFARGVVIVEGDAENILLPTLATLLDRDFTEHGVSIVNVGGVGLRRYARVFQRGIEEDKDRDLRLSIPVVCITDMDVMPNCAPTIIGKLKEPDPWPEVSGRQWRAKKDFGNGNDTLEERRSEKDAKASGQYVKTFVADEWTLEYDLALGPKDENGSFHGGLAEDVYVAAHLAGRDDEINSERATKEDEEEAAAEAFAALKAGAEAKDGCSREEVLASHIYAKFTKGSVSKAIAAQYLAERLQKRNESGDLTAGDLRKLLPAYLLGAIEYVTEAADSTGTAREGE